MGERQKRVSGMSEEGNMRKDSSVDELEGGSRIGVRNTWMKKI